MTAVFAGGQKVCRGGRDNWRGIPEHPGNLPLGPTDQSSLQLVLLGFPNTAPVWVLAAQ